MPYDATLYPPGWRKGVTALKDKHCQCCGVKGGELKRNRFGELKPAVLTRAHLDHDPWNPRARIVIWCSACHLRYDASHAQRFRKAARMAIARGQLALFEESEVRDMSP
jgi:5-methylcytosine-specific restriction endonuclease McrA